MDFARAEFFRGRVNFGGAWLFGGRIDFGDAEFCGGTVDFGGAHFPAARWILETLLIGRCRQWVSQIPRLLELRCPPCRMPRTKKRRN